MVEMNKKIKAQGYASEKEIHQFLRINKLIDKNLFPYAYVVILQ